MRGLFPILCGALLSACATAEPLADVAYLADGPLIMVPVSVNGTDPQLFMVDSGASHSVIDPRLARQLGLRVTGAATTTGTGAGAVPIEHGEASRFAIGEMVLPVEQPWLIDLSGVPIDARVRGLLGAEIFKRHVVRIDPLRRRFAVFDAARYRPPRGAVAIPLIIEGDRLFVEARLDVRPGLSVTRRLRVDTGSASSVNDASASQSATVRRTQLGNGLGASFQGVSGVFEAVHLGPYTIRNVWGPAGERSAIGMEILRRFTLTFDGPNGRLFLEPNAAFDEPVPAPQ